MGARDLVSHVVMALGLLGTCSELVLLGVQLVNPAVGIAGL